MSYYGYPNAQTYGANYAQYAAAYAAQSGTYDQYQAAAAYNAAAYSAMQMPQGNGQSNGKSQNVGNSGNGISVSGTPQRYDYTSIQSQQNQASASSGYDATAYAPNIIGQNVMPNRNQLSGPKWGQLPGQPGANKFNKQGAGGGGPGFNNRARRNPSGQPVQVFYCEVCKISCAGPQTYKEHLEGQKHKKREAANKINEAQALAAATGAPVTSEVNQPGRGRGSRPGQINGRGTNSSNLVIQCALCDVACTGKDAYSAHVRGAKHQKTIKLHQKLGKPIPPDALETMNASKQIGAAGGLPQASVISAPPQINMNRPVSQNPAIGPADPTITTTTTTTTSTPVVTNQSETNVSNPEISTNEEDELVNIEPIGKEYIETKLEGKILSFYCKLCECQFNDPNAKDMHTKGRRHRLAYKKKVDPSLRVDMKGNARDNQKRERNPRLTDKSLDNRGNQRLMNNGNLMKPTEGQIKPLMGAEANLNNTIGQGFQQLMGTQYNQYSQQNQSGYHNRYESFDDRHIIAKHNSIYPSQDEIQAIQEIVSFTEKALKLVSDQIAEEDQTPIPNDSSQSTVKPSVLLNIKEEPLDVNKENTSTEVTNEICSEGGNAELVKKPDDPQMYRALKGVMRVGLLAKGLLLKGDTDVQLIVLCAEKPTKSLLERVYNILSQKIEVISPDIKYSVILDKEAETIVIIKTTISNLQPLITCKILLTSPAVRTDSEMKAAAEEAVKVESPAAENLSEVESEDLLNKQRCLESLASLRHAKWFQARASNIPNCVVIIRVLRDLCRRNPTWEPLTQWGLELLVEKSLSSASGQLSPGEGMRRVLECVSAGILLPDGPGLHDPCEKELTDIADLLKNQQREELTSSAQMALRLLAFKQVYKILGMECLTYTQGSNQRMPRKRPANPSNDTAEGQTDEKKAKEDETSIEEESNKIPIKTVNQETTPLV